MKHLTVLFIISISLALNTAHAADLPTAVIKTTKGDITIELYPEQSPVTVKNFIDYAKADFYDGTIFHRVVKRFVIQAGGFDKNLKPKKNRDPIVNESKNGLHNDRWTVAMARSLKPDSATSQFYINMRNNNSLDPRMGKAGYTVFGKVIDGFDVVKTINALPIKSRGGVFKELPEELVIINDIAIKP